MTKINIKQELETYIEGFKRLGHDQVLYRAVMEKGQVFEGATYLQHPHFSTPKECFTNAIHILAEGLEGASYCEGYVVSPDVPILIHHAWIVQEGRVIEPTLTEREGSVYMGIVIPDVMDWLGDHYGIFDASDFIESLGYKSTRWLK